MLRRARQLTSLVTALAMTLSATTAAHGQVPAPAPRPREAVPEVLTPAQRAAVDKAIDRGVKYIVDRQMPDGSFPSGQNRAGQPAVTAFGILALLSRGHVPGRGPHGRSLDRAIDFVLSTQTADGLFSHLPTQPTHVHNGASHAATYNHGIAGLAITEAYGTTDDEARAARLRSAIERGLAFVRGFAPQPKMLPEDNGAWRYVRHTGQQSADLSVSSWMLLYLRSAKNAGFAVPSGDIDGALTFFRACGIPETGQFRYHPVRRPSWAMTAAGILSLSLAGEHNTPLARKGGDWILANPLQDYVTPGAAGANERYYYGAFYAAPAMYQLGGEHWSKFFPPFALHLTLQQAPDGSWPVEHGNDAIYGQCYTTALVVTALATPNQLLPIFQR